MNQVIRQALTEAMAVMEGSRRDDEVLLDVRVVVQMSEWDELMTAAVELTGITKRFGDVTAVDHVDLAIEDGEFFAMLGLGLRQDDDTSHDRRA